MKLSNELWKWLSEFPSADRYAIHPMTLQAIETQLGRWFKVEEGEAAKALLKQHGQTETDTDLFFKGGIPTLGGKPMRIDMQVLLDTFEIYKAGVLVASVRLLEV